MADATRTPRATEQTVTVNEDVVTLTLSVDEAKTLFTVVTRVSGSRLDSPCRYADRVYTALISAGIDFHTAQPVRLLTSGEIHFANYPNGDNTHG